MNVFIREKHQCFSIYRFFTSNKNSPIVLSAKSNKTYGMKCGFTDNSGFVDKTFFLLYMRLTSTVYTLRPEIINITNH